MSILGCFIVILYNFIKTIHRLLRHLHPELEMIVPDYPLGCGVAVVVALPPYDLTEKMSYGWWYSYIHVWYCPVLMLAVML